MGNFIEILDEFKSYNKDLDQGDDLNKFFGVITHFNGNKHMDLKHKTQIESFFEYKWKNDSNQAFKEDADIDIFSELPDHVKESLYKDFLYAPFLKKFRRTFEIPNMDNMNQYSFFSWNDQIYRDFIIAIL
jgi:hypothetical protein